MYRALTDEERVWHDLSQHIPVSFSDGAYKEGLPLPPFGMEGAPPPLGKPSLPDFVKKDIKRAKLWANKNRIKLCEILKNNKLAKILKSEGGPSEQYKTVLIYLLLIHFSEIPPLMISKLLLNFGEAKFCGEEWID